MKKKHLLEKKFSQTIMHIREKENWDLREPTATT